MQQTWHFENDEVAIRKAEVGTFGNNAYVIACKLTMASLIVDAAADPDLVVATAHGTKPIAVVTTHGHADHVGAAVEVAKSFSIPIRLHPLDWDISPIAIDEPLAIGPVQLGKTTLQFAHTPGHTPGSTSIVTAGAVLTGDTLFPGGPGATRFPYSDFDEIMNSLDTVFFSLPDDTVVMPGHGLDTTIGTERPALPEWRSRRW
ncbi:MAG: MBL fold metallo-hydrolase [Acidimicrobiia bacterium]|nr:MBL fold metallo-hydrolase [Acidimicrobiia bacterium]MDX2465896.1 MBL fold metallo-hydrolase [Acidimicrobiia bacterium]